MDIYIGFGQSNTKIIFYFSLLDDFHFSLSDSADVSFLKCKCSLIRDCIRGIVIYTLMKLEAGIKPELEDTEHYFIRAFHIRSKFCQQKQILSKVPQRSRHLKITWIPHWFLKPFTVQTSSWHMIGRIAHTPKLGPMIRWQLVGAWDILEWMGVRVNEMLFV